MPLFVLLSIWTEELSAFESLLKTSLRSLLLNCSLLDSGANATVRKKKKWNTVYWLLDLLNIISLFIFSYLLCSLLCNVLCFIQCTFSSRNNVKSTRLNLQGLHTCSTFLMKMKMLEGDTVSWLWTWCRIQILGSVIYKLLGLCLRELGWRKISFLLVDKDCELGKQ